MGPGDNSVKVSWIAEQVVLKVAPNAEIIYEYQDRGWIGDVPKFTYNTNKAKSFGWTPKMNSKQAINLAIEEIFKDIKNE